MKIAGSIVTDDGGGLEGLIGLEVLEDYDHSVVASCKVFIMRIPCTLAKFGENVHFFFRNF